MTDDMLASGGPLRFKLQVTREQIGGLRERLDLLVTELDLVNRVSPPSKAGVVLVTRARRAAMRARRPLERAHAFVGRALKEEPFSEQAMEELEDLARRNG